MEKAIQILSNEGLFIDNQTRKDVIWGGRGTVLVDEFGQRDFTHTHDWFRIEKKYNNWFGWFFYGQTSIVVKSSKEIEEVASGVAGLFRMASISSIDIEVILNVLFRLQQEYLIAEISSATEISVYPCRISHEVDVSPYYIAINKTDFIEDTWTLSMSNKNNKWLIKVTGSSKYPNTIQAENLDNAIEIVNQINRNLTH